MVFSQKTLGGSNLVNAPQILERSGLTQDMKVGAFGCGGIGYFALTSAKMVGKNGLVYAVDVLKSALVSVGERAKARNLRNVKTVWSDLEVYRAMKIADDSLDLGLLVNVLFQTKKAREMIKECVRTIKPGGKLLVVDWKKTGAPFGPRLEDRPDIDLIKQSVEASGFSVQEIFEAGPYHFGILFVKKQ